MGNCSRCGGPIMGDKDYASCLYCGYGPRDPVAVKPSILTSERKSFRVGLARELGIPVRQLSKELEEEKKTVL